MRGEGASGSWLDGLVKKDSAADAAWAASHPDAIFDVPCVTLGMYVDEHEIDLAHTFIKIDTEGAEWSLLPSLHALMAALPPGRRPTIILSPHATELREPSLGALLDFVRLFKFASRWPDQVEKQVPLPVTTASSTMQIDDLRDLDLANLEDIILSDWHPGV